ncbi:MAG: DUF3006 domain-containing protein [Desulfitobacteriaceae bacterium]|nr:DUF3006 domain-containing protein [Desulfitobacteriaceae bacterium]
MLVVVDRIEGQFAVVEFPDRTTKDVSLAELPCNTRRGDCFKYSGDKYVPAPEETARRKAEIEKLTKSLWDK